MFIFKQDAKRQIRQATGAGYVQINEIVAKFPAKLFGKSWKVSTISVETAIRELNAQPEPKCRPLSQKTLEKLGL